MPAIAKPEEKPRRVWTTLLVSFFLGPFGGFLWIGRGGLALLALAIMVSAVLYLLFFDWPLIPQVSLPPGGLGSIAGLLFAVFSVLIVLPFRKGSLPTRWFSHGLSVLLLAGILPYLAAFGLRAFVVQPFSVPAASMEPNLVIGDYFWVSKPAYGYSRFSVPLDLLPIAGRLHGKHPERGDIVVFRLPSNPTIDYAMRVVGLPGETVQMIDGLLHIDDEPVALETLDTYNSATGTVSALQRETLPNGASYLILDSQDSSVGDDTQRFEVPDGHYFVLGDNRDNAADSRFTVGFVPFENLVGRAERIFWNSQGRSFSDRSSLAPEG